MIFKFKFTSNLKRNMNDDDGFENILENSTSLLVAECFRVVFMQVNSIIESIVVVHSTCQLYDFVLIVCSVLNCVIANVMIVNFSRQFFIQLNVNEINIEIKTRQVRSTYVFKMKFEYLHQNLVIMTNHETANRFGSYLPL